MNAQRDGIGLAISGGGFRATLFHLGTLRRLLELGLLERVSHIASVSGGSITSGALARTFIESPTIDWRERIDILTKRVRDFCSDTMDVGAIVGGTLLPFVRVSDLVTNAYEPLVGEHALRELSNAPLGFTFCATNLQTGRLVHLTPERIVDYRIGRVQGHDVTIARAVAASSAFPPFLSPVVIDCRGKTWEPVKGSTLSKNADYTDTLYLTDGGAYDNMGLEPVWDYYAHVLVSDAGAPYAMHPKVRDDWLSLTYAAFEIATDQSRGLRRRSLVHDFQAGTKSGAYWGIGTPIGKYELADAMDVSDAMVERLASMRTRLDAFSPTEQETLINWGYAAADASLRRNCTVLCPPNSPAPSWPHPNTPMR